MTAASQTPAARTDTPAAMQLPVLVLAGAWDGFFPDRGDASARAAAALLQEQLLRIVLPAFLARQRWFAAKGDRIDRVAIGWQTLWKEEWLLTSVQVDLHHAGTQSYSVPLALRLEQDGAATPNVRPEDVLARVSQDGQPGILYDAFADAAFCRFLLEAMAQQTQVPLTGTGAGRLKFSSTSALARIAGDDLLHLPVHRGTAASSNSTVLFGDRLFLKAYRRLAAGINPEVEIGRFLTELSPYQHIAPLAGALEFHDGAGTSTALMMLQGCVANQGDAWTRTLDRLCASLKDCVQADADGQQSEAIDEADMRRLATLGRRTGELHCALAATTGDPAFDPEPIHDADLQQWTRQVGAEAAQSLDQLERGLARLPESQQPRARALLAARPAVLARIQALRPAAVEAVVTRYHGDYHLGQVLVVGDDFILIDFEGEPSRTLKERRSKHSPLRDVAGMLRSFSYAANSALGQLAAGQANGAADTGVLAALAKDWERRARTAFLTGYREAVQACPAYPGDARAAASLLELFVLEKAFYELRYELDNRPDWVHVPLSGLSELLLPE